MSPEHARTTLDCEPRTPSYVAAYLRTAGDECAFIEAYTTHAVPGLLAALASAGRRPEQVRWVVVTHAHLDHAGGASALMAACPNATLLAHPRAARHLIDPAKLVKSATAVYGAAKFEEMYGTIAPVDASRVRALEDGETFELGDATLRVHHTRGHAKHHFVVDDPALSTVYTGDTFGLVYPMLQRAGTFAFPSTSPTDFEPDEARKSLARVLGLGETFACPTHFGEVTDLKTIALQMGRWIDLSEAWLEEAVKSDAPLEEVTATVERSIREALEDAARARGLSLDAEDWALLAMDVALNAQGVAFVAGKRRSGGG